MKITDVGKHNHIDQSKSRFVLKYDMLINYLVILFVVGSLRWEPELLPASKMLSVSYSRVQIIKDSELTNYYNIKDLPVSCFKR